MANITVLDQNTINKIAAGEVVERPASVVKELLENAIDAKATAITVEIKDGGISFIRVTDNGCGIPQEEIPLAFLRHATSKIHSVEDLFTISSLGFRGEALASIAAVSQVELITKTPEAMIGFRYQIEGGKEKGLEEVGAPAGTTFIARNLFYNTPARKKFLKAPATEGGHVADLVQKIAMSHPEISIRFIQNNQNKLYTSGNHKVKDLVYTIFGREVAGNLLDVEEEVGEMRITGFVGKPVIARNNRNYEHYFINGRFIKSGLIARAIEEAYKPFMMQHKYPFVMLYFTIEPEFLDINVHPTKMELRFRDGELLFQMVYQAVSHALAHKELIPQVEADAADKAEKKEEERLRAKVLAASPEPFEQKRMGLYEQTLKQLTTMPKDGFLRERQFAAQEGGDGQIRRLNPLRLETETLAAENAEVPKTSAISGTTETSETGREKTIQMELFEDRFLGEAARQKHRLIGQLFATYWLVEYHDQLFIIDQHAAHEKILFEQTMRALKTRDFGTQMLNPPIILTLSAAEEVLLKRYLTYFLKIGFEIEHFGGMEYAVRGVPANLFSIARKELLLEMLDGLSDDGVMKEPDSIYEHVASISCKAAVKGNHVMSEREADALIDQLLTMENPYACPHGRPTIVSMSKYEMEKKFKRIV
ncbi:MAG: DNA mismatch repair endonuclease MutL [Lachnospiraceae bacterium]|nr:DNA mismatch repair endonuclease MutL [Lachnospiraceae bacterium]